MFISYENEEIRDCCLLLRPASLNSSFSSEEIKEIRAIIADLKATPKLTDSPLKYLINRENLVLEIEYGHFKIICKIISKHHNPLDHQIDRIKITKIFNIGLQADVTKMHKNNLNK